MQSVANHNLINEEILLKFESQLSSYPAAYAKALAALRWFIRSRNSLAPFNSRLFLESWLFALCLKGLSFKTASLYLNIITAMYSSEVKKGNLDPSPAFQLVKARLAELGPCVWRHTITPELYHSFVDKIRHSYHSSESSPGINPSFTTLVSLLIFALFNPSLSLSEIAALKKDDLGRFSPESREIAKKCLKPRHRFIFPLQQSRLTSRQLKEHVENLMTRFFGHFAIPLFGSADETIRSYWAFAAAVRHVPPHLILSVTGSLPFGFPSLSILTPDSSSFLGGDYVREASSLISSISSSFISNPRRWFILNLRTGVKYDDFLQRKDSDPDFPADITLFYPMEEITRKVDNRFLLRKRPVISNVIFVNSTPEALKNLLNRAGDLVWAYRSSILSSRYAIVPDHAMHAFQTAIGQFSSGIEVAPIGTFKLQPGEKIVVIGGVFSGLQGEFLREHFTESGTVYRIRLFGDKNDIEWRVRDSRLLKKLKKD